MLTKLSDTKLQISRNFRKKATITHLELQTPTKPEQSRQC